MWASWICLICKLLSLTVRLAMRARRVWVAAWWPGCQPLSWKNPTANTAWNAKPAEWGEEVSRASKWSTHSTDHRSPVTSFRYVTVVQICLILLFTLLCWPVGIVVTNAAPSRTCCLGSICSRKIIAQLLSTVGKDTDHLDRAPVRSVMDCSMSCRPEFTEVSGKKTRSRVGSNVRRPSLCKPNIWTISISGNRATARHIAQAPIQTYPIQNVVQRQLPKPTVRATVQVRGVCN